jgi:hypothetical protein
MEFKKIQYLKITWLKNAGSMAHLIENKKQENRVIWHNSKKWGNMWAEVSNDDLLRLTKKDNNIYECLSDFPHKVSFDIDADNKDYNIYDKIVPYISKIFPNSDMVVSGSISEKRQSYHIILNNYLIRNIEDRKYIESFVKVLKNKFDDSFDTSIYRKNKFMKLFNQSKEDGRIQKIILNEDEKKHFITTFINNDTFETLPTLEQEEYRDIKTEMKVIEAKTTKFNVGDLPKTNLILKDISKIKLETLTPLEILEFLPLNSSMNHDYTHLVARYCFYNDLSFNHFCSWYKNKKDDEATFKKWAYHWDNLHKFPKVYQNQIETILYNFYPNLRTEKHFKNFENLFKLENIQKIDSLNQDIYYSDKKFLCINTGMGSGKTYQTVEYLKDKDNFIWITPNIALAQNTRQRLNQANINVSYYKDFKTSDEKEMKIDKQEKLMICLNSLHYTHEKKYKILVIDEIETVLNKWFKNSTLEGMNKINNWVRFLEIINNADKVIFLDAFTSKITIDFIESLGNINNHDIIELKNINVNRNIYFKPSFNSWLNKIIKTIKDNKKTFIFYPFKKGSTPYVDMENFKKIIETQTNKKGVCYHGETDDKILKDLDDVNTHWENYDFVITNNKINVGINYEKNDFDSVFLSISSFSSPRDIVQVSYRCRNLKSKNIYVSYLKTQQKNDSFENDYKTVDGCQIYKKLIDNILIEKFSPLKSTFNYFCKLAHYKIKITNEEIDKDVEKMMKKLFEDVELDYTYDTIKNIDTHSTLELIQQKIYNMEASMYDKITIKKYYYQKQFKDNKHNLLAFGWDKNYIGFLKKIHQLLQDENNIYEKIREFNNWESIIPEDKELEKVKLNDQLIDRIFEENTFKDLTKKSSHINIIKNIYNNNLEKTIIKSRCDKNKNNYELYIDDELREMFYFACNNLKIDKEENKNIITDFLDEEIINDEPIIKENKPAKYIEFGHNESEANPKEETKVETRKKFIESFEDLQNLSKKIKANKPIKKKYFQSILPSLKIGETTQEYRTRMINLLFI